MKRICALLTAALLLMLTALTAAGVPEGELLLRTGNVTVLIGDTGAAVHAQMGAPLLETRSAFGGAAFTFAGDKGFLYLETDASDVVMAAATIDSDFTARGVAYGDRMPALTKPLAGYASTDARAQVQAACVYHPEADADAYWAAWDADTELYLEGLVRHGIAMFNAAAERAGKRSGYMFDEAVFLANEQLKYSGQNLVRYASLNGKQSSIHTAASLTDRTLGTSDAPYLPNPLMFARYAYTASVRENCTAPYFDCYRTAIGFAVNTAFVDPELLDARPAVELTQEERQAVQEAVDAFQSAQDRYFSAMNGLYDESPSVSLPLRAGAVSADVQEAVCGYVNAVRAAAGLQPLALSQDLSGQAQHKAVLLAYLALNNIPYESGPLPCPDGVDPAFCAEADRTLSCDAAVTQDVLASVSRVLAPATADEAELRRVYGLLGARAQGIASWPADGVLVRETVQSMNFVWSAKLPDSLRTTEDTAVTVRRENDGRTWLFDTPVDTAACKFAVYGDLIAFYSEEFSPHHGDVFTVTITGLSQNGASARYGYRVIVQEAALSGATVLKSISLKQDSVRLAPGETADLQAKGLPATAKNQRIRFSTSDASVATVDARGRITAHGSGKCTVTAVSEGSGVTAVCAVRVTQPWIEAVDGGLVLDAQRGYLSGVGPGITPQALLARLDGHGGTIRIAAPDGGPASGYVGTGCRVTLSYGGADVEELAVVIYGDVTGDGAVSSADALRLAQHLLGTAPLEGAPLEAGRVGPPSEWLGAADLLTLKSYLLSIGTLSKT